MNLMTTAGRPAAESQTTLFAPSLPPRREMERAFLGSDATFDGIFFTGVRTTGIFCRPSCRARKPLPGNIEFFASVHDALFAGYRPCRGCLSMLPAAPAPGWLIPRSAAIEEQPNQRPHDRDLSAL